MYAKLTIPERLKDLRVVDKHLTLEQLAEQTGLSKSALGKYETDDYKDISPFAIATLADFYGVSADYLMGLTDNKEVPNADVQSLHLNDEMIELLRSGKINNRLLCELATHPNFRRLMVDMEICIDQIANMRVEQMNLVMEATRQAIHQGSDIEMLIHEFCDKLQIPFEKISSEDFSAFLRILSLSKILKNPNNMRGKTSPIPLNRKARRKQK
jgi:transcriptional regulator with XRE-family HTH domain|nr:helix-turn-helix transcriptional regulator [uncultured Oscillibacter sp.]